MSVLNVSSGIFAVNQLILSLVRADNRSSSVDPGQRGEILERDLPAPQRDANSQMRLQNQRGCDLFFKFGYELRVLKMEDENLSNDF